jgi:hypothetical protein
MNEILGALLGLNDIEGEDDSSGVDELLGELLEGESDTLGADDLAVLGSDDLAILGAALSAKSKGAKSLLKRAIAGRKLAGAQVLSPRKPSSSGVQPIGFFQAGVAAGTQATITTQPQTWFKPQRLVVPDSIGPFFTIDNIVIGNISQFPSPVPLPAEMFGPAAQAVVMDLATVNPALNLTIVATNISGVPQNFRAGFIGKEVTP